MMSKALNKWLQSEIKCWQKAYDATEDDVEEALAYALKRISEENGFKDDVKGRLEKKGYIYKKRGLFGIFGK